MTEDSFIQARRELLDKTREELIGSHFEQDVTEEVITEKPISRYTVGILYPQKAEIDLQEEVDDTAGNEASSKDERSSHLDNHINIANQYYPSAMGLSFYVSGINPEINIKVNTTKYIDTELDDCFIEVNDIPELLKENKLFKAIFSYDENLLFLKREFSKEEREKILKIIKENFPKDYDLESIIYDLYSKVKYGWKRMPISKKINISEQDKIKEVKEITDGLKIKCIKRPDYSNKMTLCTVSLINCNDVEGQSVRKDELSFFQSGFEVSSVNNNFLEYNLDKLSTMDEEEKSLALLYRHKKSYAVGHGCAADWEESNSKIKRIYTSILPEYEVPQVEFIPEELEKNNSEILKMKNLSDISKLTIEEIISGLNEFCNFYKGWIDNLKEKGLNNVQDDLLVVANKHIENCYEALQRMKRGIKLIEENEKIKTAFLFANKAMLMQIEHSILQKEKRFPGEKDIEWPDYGSSEIAWRPFQLAFLLMSIEGIDDSDCDYRDIVDLIWFPTGGGKTEAYLGLIAFTVFLRRLRYPVKGGGTIAIMRYTLRLLTAQQFQRASGLICACELIRRNHELELGEEKISLGLWIGRSSTPNYRDEAFKELNLLVNGRSRNNRFQVLSCPWCGTKMELEDGKGEWGYREGRRPKRLILYCPEKSCKFNIDEELPIKVIDEDIYKDPPTLLFSTVDKFAAMPWRKEISSLFALDEGNEKLSPELIIQDELHLISGPLGTIVGLYETALEALCSEKGIRPKIVASTATIRRAKDQCKALYNRGVRQFPPQGLDSRDSYFAREIPIEKKPGRLYAGIMSSGKTQTTTEIRLMAALLQLCNELDYEDEIIDKYWTLTGYFNSLKELGRCSTMVNDDIKDQIKRIADRNDKKERRIFRAEELTGRKKAREIPLILEKLEKEYPDENVINVLLATNMISVGIDVSRLGLMVVVGQPKTTSEYIQATSRVGRAFPGLVFTLYDGARARDRSHYERFVSYHQSFYRFVEPTSVTPFSGPARDRALHAVFITCIRHILGLRKDNQINDFNSDIKGLDRIKQTILNRVKQISGEEVKETKQQLENLIMYLEDIVRDVEDMRYSINNYKPYLLYPFGKNDKYLGTLQSMRNVDQPCNIHILD